LRTEFKQRDYTIIGRYAYVRSESLLVVRIDLKDRLLSHVHMYIDREQDSDESEEEGDIFGGGLFD
jgi:hypothetical protein